MIEDEIKRWIADPHRADTLPFGVYEPAYQKGITVLRSQYAASCISATVIHPPCVLHW